MTHLWLVFLFREMLLKSCFTTWSRSCRHHAWVTCCVHMHLANITFGEEEEAWRTKSCWVSGELKSEEYQHWGLTFISVASFGAIFLLWSKGWAVTSQAWQTPVWFSEFTCKLCHFCHWCDVFVDKCIVLRLLVTDELDSGLFPQLKALWVLLDWEQEDRTPPLRHQPLPPHLQGWDLSPKK